MSDDAVRSKREEPAGIDARPDEEPRSEPLDRRDSGPGADDSGAAEGRGWGTVGALALVAVGFSIVHPALLIFVPLSLLLLALPPWRPTFAVLALALAAVAFLDPGGDPLWYVERGWVLLLGAWFIVTVVAWPAAGFLARGLAALAAALTSVGVLLLANGGAWGRLDWTIARQLRDGAADVMALWGAVPDEWSREVSRAIYGAVDLQAQLYPALLALASLAALGVAWWAYRRLAAREPRPLSPLREFRFRDELVWLVIAGILLVVLPLGEAALRTGSNVLTFMAALYALRGAAVMLVLVGTPGLGGILLAAFAILFLYPLVMAATVVVGLTDTWLDLRARRSPPAHPGS